MVDVMDLGKMLDDLQAAKEDLDSGDNRLQAHALGSMAAISTELADIAAKIPIYGPRFSRMLLEQADECLDHKTGIERVPKLNAGFDKRRARQNRADQVRLEAKDTENERVGQADMFSAAEYDACQPKPQTKNAPAARATGA